MLGISKIAIYLYKSKVEVLLYILLILFKQFIYYIN